MASGYLLRIIISFFSALLITGFLCMLAPLISRENSVSFIDSVPPIQVFSLPTLENKKEIEKVRPREIIPLPKTPKPPIKKQPPLEKVFLTMKPLKLEFPAIRAATLPSAPPQIKKGQVGSSFGDGGIYELGAVDTHPKLQKYVPPLYPPAAKGKRIEGKIVVRCVVTTKGRVKDAKILSAEPVGYFEKAALKAIAKWTFVSARHQGKKVPVYVDIPLSFSLD